MQKVVRAVPLLIFIVCSCSVLTLQETATVVVHRAEYQEARKVAPLINHDKERLILALVWDSRDLGAFAELAYLVDGLARHGWTNNAGRLPTEPREFSPWLARLGMGGMVEFPQNLVLDLAKLNQPERAIVELQASSAGLDTKTADVVVALGRTAAQVTGAVYTTRATQLPALLLGADAPLVEHPRINYTVFAQNTQAMLTELQSALALPNHDLRTVNTLVAVNETGQQGPNLQVLLGHPGYLQGSWIATEDTRPYQFRGYWNAEKVLGMARGQSPGRLPTRWPGRSSLVLNLAELHRRGLTIAAPYLNYHATSTIRSEVFDDIP